MWQLPFNIPDGGRFNGAIFGGGKVVSQLVISTGGESRSEDWVLGTSGWIIRGDGSVEFNNGVFRGAISASTIDIGGSDATSFHVDIDGNMWVGAATFATAPFRVANTGALDIGGTDATSFHVDVNGNLWLGASAFASAPFKVANTGAVTLDTSLEMGSGGTIATGPSSQRRIRMYGFGGSGAFVEGINASNVIDGLIKWSDSVLQIRGNASMDLEVTSTAGGSIVSLFEINSSSPFFSMSNGSGQLDVNLILKETSHSSSKRSAIIHENVGQIGVDINGNGTRDWYIYDSVGGYTPFVITFASGRADIGGGFGPSLGPWVAGGSYACFAHNGMFGTSASYALLQDNLGNTYINSPSGQETFHRIANTTIARTTGAGFYVSMPGSSSTTDVVDGGSGLLAVFTSRRANKKNIAPIPNPIQKFMALNPVTYQWRRGVGIDGDRNPFVDRLVRHGFVAEELAEVDHDLASWGVLRPFGHDASPKSMNDTRPDPTVEDIVPVSINVRGILALTVAVVQELVRRIEALEST